MLSTAFIELNRVEVKAALCFMSECEIETSDNWCLSSETFCPGLEDWVENIPKLGASCWTLLRPLQFSPFLEDRWCLEEREGGCCGCAGDLCRAVCKVFTPHQSPKHFEIKMSLLCQIGRLGARKRAHRECCHCFILINPEGQPAELRKVTLYGRERKKKTQKTKSPHKPSSEL